MNQKDVAIGVFSTTATILFVALLIVHSRPEPALASGMTAASGSYVFTVGRTDSDQEVLYVLNTAAKKMITYRMNLRKGRIEIATPALNLDQLRPPEEANNPGRAKQ